MVGFEFDLCLLVADREAVMEDFYLSEKVSENRLICVSPLSRKSYKEAGARGLGGHEGYFIYETDCTQPSTGIEIIAKVASLEAALRLFTLIRHSQQQGAIV